jgi:hypothetical protein
MIDTLLFHRFRIPREPVDEVDDGAVILASLGCDKLGDVGELEVIGGVRTLEFRRCLGGEVLKHLSMSLSKCKFYAVRQCYVPGIYCTWEECRQQVEGFSCQEFKSFKTYRNVED